MSIRRATTVVTLAALALVVCSDDEPSDEAREVTTSTSHPSATTTTTSTEPDLRLVTIGDSIPYGLGDCGGCDTFTTLFSDFEGSCLTVRRTITTIRHQPVAGDVKSARSRRTLDVDAATMAVLRSHRTAQLEQRMLMGAGYDDRGLVFAMPDGRPWNPDTITQAFERLVRASDLPGCVSTTSDMPTPPTSSPGCEREGRQRASRPCLRCLHPRRLWARPPRPASRRCRGRGGSRRRLVTNP